VSGRAPYSRVYWSIIDDDRFAVVYDDDAALSAWLRLLLIADQAWPASAHLPIGIKAAALSKLVETGLVVVTGSRYRIHGLDAERERRARRTQEDAQPEPNNAPVAPQQVPNKSPVSPSRARAPRLVSSMDSSTTGGGPGEGLPNLDSMVARVWEEATGRSVLASGAFACELLDDACKRHPTYEVCAAILRARKGFDHVPAVQPMAAAVRAILDPFVDPKAAAAKERELDEKLARRRAVEATLRNNHELGGHPTPDPRCPLCQEAAVTA